jgi:DNA-binding transcriptional LysR family regulator
MSMTLVQLETFAQVAAHGNFTRVAEELHLTQPGVTQHVRALERHFGVKLVDLVGRRPVLTDAGRFLASRATDILGNVAALEREMGEFAQARGGELQVGASLTIGAYVLPMLLARFSARHPGVTVRITVANTPAVAGLIRNGALGLALVEGPLEGDDLRIEPFQNDRLVLIARPHSPFVATVPVDPWLLHGAPFIWREAGSGTRALAELGLATLGVTPRTVLELPSGEGVARAVEAGMGLAILSQLVVEHAVREQRLVAADIAGVDLRRTFRLISLRTRTLSPAAHAFMAVVREKDQTAI